MDARPDGAAHLSPRLARTIDGSKEPYSLALVQRLRELGFADGNNLQITYRHAGGRIERLPSLAAELVKLNPDVLIGSGLEANLVALTQAGGDIPIVFIAVGDRQKARHPDPGVDPNSG